MKRILCAPAFALALVLTAFLAAGTAAGAARLAPEDERFLSSAIEGSYPDASFAEKTGIAAVVLRLAGMPGHPDTVGGVVAACRAEGEFGGFRDEPRRTALDAVRAAEEGADPAHGAVRFRVFRASCGVDFRFDNAREERIRRAREKALQGYEIVIGNTGFGRDREDGG